jgi:hypothetical protein
MEYYRPKRRNWRKPSLVVAALAPMLRGQAGRNLGDNDDTTRHLLGRSVRVLAFGLAFMPLASRMIRRRRGSGGTGDTGTRRDKQKLPKVLEIGCLK